MRTSSRSGRALAPLLVSLAALVAAGCGGNDTDTSGGTSSAADPFGPLGDRADLPVDEQEILG